MSNKTRQGIGLFLLMVYAFFFASTQLFYHTHQLSDAKVVHSHVWDGKAHSHTAVQFQNIDQLTTLSYENADFVALPHAVTEPIVENLIEYQAEITIADPGFTFSLRAPPALDDMDFTLS